MNIKFRYISIISIYVLQKVVGQYQDHVVQWDPSNKVFTESNNIMYVHEGDNVIFLCSKDSTNLKVFWTTSLDVYNNCNEEGERRLHNIFECETGKETTDFILKISHFSELAGVPHYLSGKPVLFIAQSPWCSNSNMKLATILENDRMMFFRNDNILLAQSKVMEATQKQKLKSMTSLESTKFNQNRFTEETSDWDNYRFLLLPGSLALLTLIGMQIVVCTLCLPKSVKRYLAVCNKRERRQSSQSIPKDNNANDSNLTTVSIRNFDPTSSNSERYIDKTISHSFKPHQCCPLMINQGSQHLKYNGYLSVDIEKYVHLNQQTKLFNKCKTQLPYCNGTASDNAIYYHVYPDMDQALWIPFPLKSMPTNIQKDERSTIRFAISS